MRTITVKLINGNEDTFPQKLQKALNEEFNIKGNMCTAMSKGFVEYSIIVTR